MARLPPGRAALLLVACSCRAAAAAAAFSSPAVPSSPPGRSSSSGGGFSSSSIPFNCSFGYHDWEAKWSTPKKDWCCDHEHRACDKHQCEWGTVDKKLGVEGWPVEKRTWCCKEKSLFCATTTSTITTQRLFACDAGYENWEAGWSTKQKEWCCKHSKRACDRYQCQLSLFDARQGIDAWPAEKRSWCCANKHVFCALANATLVSAPAAHTETWTPAPPAPIVPAGQAPAPPAEVPSCTGNFETWPRDTRAWCCDHRQIACDPWNCEWDLATSEASWSAEKAGWCCGVKNLGCRESRPKTTRLPFDCDAGFYNWETGWSGEKKTWCCVHEHKACDPWDCEKDFDTWEVAWQAAKKGWCCSTHKRGCHSDSTTGKVFDCNVGLAYWENAWPADQRAWCCKTLGRACGKFDCQFDFATWQESWEPEKKTWCCQHEHRGCVETTTVLYDCDSDTEGWPDPQKAWCCSNRGRGCISTMAPSTTAPSPVTTSPVFDCYAGFDGGRWQTGWSEARKQWCCTQAGRGCPPSQAAQTAPAAIASPVHFDCQFQEQARASWPKPKKEYCCEHQGMCDHGAAGVQVKVAMPAELEGQPAARASTWTRTLATMAGFGLAGMVAVNFAWRWRNRRHWHPQGAPVAPCELLPNSGE